MAYDDFKEGCSVIKDYVDTAIGQIAQPSSLPQTYKKKAVTLAANGWEQGTAIVRSENENGDEINLGTATYPFGKIYPYSGDLREIVKTKSTQIKLSNNSFNNSKAEVFENQTNPLTGGTETATRVTYYYESYRGIVCAWFFSNCIGVQSTYHYYSTFKVLLWKSDLYTQSYTDADVKVNSEVRFTLDEANGKLAGQFGLKKTIDKEAGKLTFTADTLPTSAISGTLEIGETSTEGAAFVEGITSDTDIPQRTTKDTTLTSAGWSNNQQEVSVGDLSPTDDVSPIFATDSAEQAYKDAEITGKIGTNKVVFTCKSVPTADIPLTLVITRW